MICVKLNNNENFGRCTVFRSVRPFLMSNTLINMRLGQFYLDVDGSTTNTSYAILI